MGMGALDGPAGRANWTAPLRCISVGLDKIQCAPA